MEQLINLDQLTSGFYLISTDVCTKDMFQQSTEINRKKIGNIKENWQLLPFLTLKDNLLLGVRKKMQTALLEQLALVEISPVMLNQPAEELAPLTKIKLQIVRQLLQEKEVLLLSECCSVLSIGDIQWLLPFCQQLSEEMDLKILLFSSDKQLFHVPYIDIIF